MGEMLGSFIQSVTCVDDYPIDTILLTADKVPKRPFPSGWRVLQLATHQNFRRHTSVSVRPAGVCNVYVNGVKHKSASSDITLISARHSVRYGWKWRQHRVTLHWVSRTPVTLRCFRCSQQQMLARHRILCRCPGYYRPGVYEQP